MWIEICDQLTDLSKVFHIWRHEANLKFMTPTGSVCIVHCLSESKAKEELERVTKLLTRNNQ